MGTLGTPRLTFHNSDQLFRDRPVVVEYGSFDSSNLSRGANPVPWIEHPVFLRIVRISQCEELYSQSRRIGEHGSRGLGANDALAMCAVFEELPVSPLSSALASHY